MILGYLFITLRVAGRCKFCLQQQQHQWATLMFWDADEWYFGSFRELFVEICVNRYNWPFASLLEETSSSRQLCIAWTRASSSYSSLLRFCCTIRRNSECVDVGVVLAVRVSLTNPDKFCAFSTLSCSRFWLVQKWIIRVQLRCKHFVSLRCPFNHTKTFSSSMLHWKRQHWILAEFCKNVQVIICSYLPFNVN